MQEGAHGAAAKAMTKEENEAVLQHMLLEGSLQLDFGFTAYATNVYLKAGPKAGSILQVSAIATPAPAPQREHSHRVATTAPHDGCSRKGAGGRPCSLGSKKYARCRGILRKVRLLMYVHLSVLGASHQL